MEFMRYSNIPSAPNSSAWECRRREPTHYTFTVELCGIWLGELPRNQHLEATLMPPHMSHAYLQSHRWIKSPSTRSSQQLYAHNETILPQRSSRKHSSSSSHANKTASTDQLFKRNCFDSTANSGFPFFPYALQLEACRIFGTMHFSNGCLVFSTRDSKVKIPMHLGGPGDADLCNYVSPSSVRRNRMYEFDNNRTKWESANSVNQDFGLFDWMLSGGRSSSFQSLLIATGNSSANRTISTSQHPQVTGSTTSLWSPAVKKGIKQFLSFISKKPKNISLETGASTMGSRFDVAGNEPVDPSDNATETLRFDWPLNTLRHFAFNGCLFKMETGRRAPYGEGHYLFRVRNLNEFQQTLEAHIRIEKRTRSMKSRSLCYGFPASPLFPSQPHYTNLPAIVSPQSNTKSRFSRRPWSQFIPSDSSPSSCRYSPHVPSSSSLATVPAADMAPGNAPTQTPPALLKKDPKELTSLLETGSNLHSSRRQGLGLPRRRSLTTDREERCGGEVGGLKFSHFQIDAGEALPVITETQSDSTGESAASGPVTGVRDCPTTSSLQPTSRAATYENVRSIFDQVMSSSPQTPKLLRLDKEDAVSPAELPRPIEVAPKPGKLHYASLDFHQLVTEPILIQRNNSNEHQQSQSSAPISSVSSAHRSRFERLSKSASILNTSTPVLLEHDNEEVPLTCRSDTQAKCFDLFCEGQGEEIVDEDGATSQATDYVDICPLQTIAMNELLKNTT